MLGLLGRILGVNQYKWSEIFRNNLGAFKIKFMWRWSKVKILMILFEGRNLGWELLIVKMNRLELC